MVGNSNGVVADKAFDNELSDKKIMVNDDLEENESTSLEDGKDIDYIYDKIVGGGSLKDFGQWMILLALISVSFLSSWPIYVNLFAGFKPRHRCLVPNCDMEETIVDMSPDWISKAIPKYNHSNSDTCQVQMVKEDERFDSCHKYSTTNENTCNVESFNISSIENCDSFVYEDSVVIESFVTKFSLVCEKEYWNAVLRGLMVLGLFFGSLMCGLLGDKLGRKMVMFLSTIVAVPNVMFAGFSTHLWLYFVLFFINVVTLP